MKYSYEGEGPYLGIKTLFLQYPKDKLIFDVGINNIYINTEVFDDKLYQKVRFWLQMSKEKHLTIETSAALPKKFKKLKRLDVFYVTNVFSAGAKYLDFKKHFIKIRVLNLKDLDKRIDVANLYANSGWKVLLMPEVELDKIGKIMMDKYDKIHKGVRFMPPIQDILKIE